MDMLTIFFAILLSFVILQEVNLTGFQTHEYVIERVTGAPPAGSAYLSGDSGAKVRRANRNSSPGLYLFFNVTKAVPNSTQISMRLYEGHNNAFKAVLIEYKKSLCDYLLYEKRPQMTPLKDLLNLPPSCPVEPGIYKLDNWQAANIMPATLPISDSYKIIATADFDKKDAIAVGIFVRRTNKS